MRTLTFLGLGLIGLATLADEPPAAELKAGGLLPGPFHIYNVTGERADKLSCLICRNGLNPVMAIFARADADEAVLADLLQKLDATVARHADVRMGAFAVFLHDPEPEKRQALIDKLRTLEKDKELKHVVLAIAPADWPKDFNPAYALPLDVNVRVLPYYRHRVKGVHDFTTARPLTDKDVSTLLEEAEKLVPPRVQPPKDKPVSEAKKAG